MKKLILASMAVVALMTTACGGGYGGTVETADDSVAYAIGVNVGNALFSNTDSTMNYQLVCKGIADVFEKNANMLPEESEKILQHFYTQVLPERKSKANEQASSEFLASAAKEAGAVTSESGLIYVMEEAGAEHKVEVGDTVSVHYTLYDLNGNKLESSYDRGTPMTYPFSTTGMIKGFTEGIALLGEGGKATLYIPSELGYGDQGSRTIGPKQALKFEIEVTKVAQPTK